MNKALKTELDQAFEQLKATTRYMTTEAKVRDFIARVRELTARVTQQNLEDRKPHR
jgi:hypothetical protein